MDDITEKTAYSHLEDKIVVKRSEDVSKVADYAAHERASKAEHGAYMKSNLVHAAKLPMIIIEQMALGQCCSDGIKYNLMSPDPEEQRRALLHVQTCHKEWLVINGKPFAKKRAVWE